MTKTSEELKDLGNTAFGVKDYETAMRHYSEAIRVDPKNHVLYSNRSACYASLQENEKAVEDAKECIRLDPSFVKGYYRLVTAQIALKLYDSALATIRQGLSVDKNNSQLMKQQRLVQQLKREHEASQKKRQELASKDSPASSNGGISSASGTPYYSSEFQELLAQYTQCKKEHEMEQVLIHKLEREEKIATLTQEDLGTTSSEQKCYRSIGKMFLLSPKEAVLQHLNGTIREAQKKQGESQQKMAYLEKKMLSQQQNLQELQKQQQQQHQLAAGEQY